MPIDDEHYLSNGSHTDSVGCSSLNAKLHDLETDMTIRLDLDQRRTVKHVRYNINDLTGETTLELGS